MDSAIIKNESELLCSSCKEMLQVSHMVQCSCCNSIVNFIKADPSEDPIVFHVVKCSNCHGSIEDEINIQPSYFPEAFV
ncbi:MAG: hypothetical protein JEY94_16515 [Melioribacteraceae bacterium]|nr:hypothetical protein [Melioribacteraceae bacterium]